MSAQPKHRNWILDRLPSSELATLSSDLKPVSLEKDMVLFEPGEAATYIYFPTSSVISFLGDTGDGGGIEVWAVGWEGVAGVSSILERTKPFRGVVQVTGDALVAKVDAFRRHFNRRGGLHKSILGYHDYLLVQVSYLGICNNRHSIQQRFSRWLLMLQDRAGSSELKFTQDAIAGILGTRRATISATAAALQHAGAISYTPGSIRIKSRRELQRIACRCYKIISSR
jgi:CRP-like cAMP-binding protein